MLFNKGLLLLIFFTCLPVANAADYQSPITHFAIKPLSCIVSKQGDQCQLNAVVEWQASSAVNVCLTQDDQKLYCWPEAQYGKKSLPVAITSNTTFILLADSNIQLASQQVVISATKPKKKRRRLRSGWSIF